MSTTEQTAVPTGTFELDPVHSSVGFEVEYMGIGAFTGTVKEVEASVVDGKLTGAAAIATVQTKDDNLTAHLLAPDFFDAEKFPKVSFSGTAQPNGTFAGEITLKGITQPATLTGSISDPVTDPYGNQRIGLKLETTIDRTAFGIDWNADMPDGSKALSNNVKLTADLSLKQAA